MKKYIFLLLLFICQSNLFAQSDTKTLFGDNGIVNTNHLDFFIAPSYEFTQMDGSNVTILNLRSGIIFKDRFSIGGYFKTSHNESRPKSETFPNVYLEYWTVGGFAEYTLLSKKVIHATFPLYVGFGKVQMNNNDGKAGLGEKNMFQVEPSALLEVNFFESFRLNLGIGYRIIAQMEYRNLNHSDISGLTGYLGLKYILF